MTQITLGTSGFELSRKRTRKREYLDEINPVVAGAELVRLSSPTNLLARPAACRLLCNLAAYLLLAAMVHADCPATGKGAA